MKKHAFRLVLLVAAVLAGIWPAFAGQAGNHASRQAGAMASHHMADHHGGHQTGMMGHAVQDAGAQCAQGGGKFTPGHCASMLLACGTGLAGTLPAVTETLPLTLIQATLWFPVPQSFAAHAVPPDLRPPRHAS